MKMEYDRLEMIAQTAKAVARRYAQAGDLQKRVLDWAMVPQLIAALEGSGAPGMELNKDNLLMLMQEYVKERPISYNQTLLYWSDFLKWLEENGRGRETDLRVEDAEQPAAQTGGDGV